jgi:hypothetical protein
MESQFGLVAEGVQIYNLGVHCEIQTPKMMWGHELTANFNDNLNFLDYISSEVVQEILYTYEDNPWQVI